MPNINNYIPGLGRGSTIVSGDIDPKVTQYISVPLTATQIQGMSTAPVTVIAAPGSGFALIPTDAVLELSSGTAYAAGGATGLSYGGTSVFIVGTVGSAAFYGTAGTTVYMGSVNGVTIPSNTGIFIGNAGANFTTGTETGTLNIWYSVIPV